MRLRAPGLRVLGVAFILLWSLVPIYWAVKTSVQHEVDATSRPAHYLPTNPTLEHYGTLLGTGANKGSDTSSAIRQSALNTAIECLGATLITVAIATLAAYAFARLRFRGSRIAFYAVLVTMAFPAYTTLIPLYRLMTTLHLVNTYTGIILVYVSGFLPLATWILFNYLGSLPLSIEEAALCDGATRLQVLRRIVIPLALPGIISTTIITFLFAWAQFLFPLVLSSDISTQPMTVVISALQARHTVPFSLLNASGVIAIIVPAAITLGLSRYIVNGLLAGSVKA